MESHGEFGHDICRDVDNHGEYRNGRRFGKYTTKIGSGFST